MKTRFTEREPAYLRERREALSSPVARFLVGMFLCAASAAGVGLALPGGALG